jgi:predicted enzyme related to lactoylglutathione lyase
MPDGTVQSPGGWNRISIEVDDLTSTVDNLRKAGCKFRNEIVTGVGGKQILLQDSSGNLIELFQYLHA